MARIALAALALVAGYLVVDRLVGNVGMVFYGRVVDERGLPVADALVWGESCRKLPLWTMLHLLWKDDVTCDKWQTLSSSDGRFEVRAHGFALAIDGIDRAGYIWPKRDFNGESFQFTAEAPGAPVHRSDSARPVDFVLSSER